MPNTWHAPSFDTLWLEYEALWNELIVDKKKLAAIDLTVNSILKNRKRYETVAASTAVPWFVIALIHSMEASCNFKCHLHNGDPLTARTVQVPKGRPPVGNPPFTWEESAIDALRYDGLAQLGNWSVALIAYRLEGYNGWGYRHYHAETKSPYLWCFGNHYTSGKYVADGKWSPTAVSNQCGAMVLLRRLADKNTDVAKSLEATPAPVIAMGGAPTSLLFQAVAAEWPWIQIAKGELGQRDYPGPQYNQRVLEYLKTTGHQGNDDETSWCSAFVNWCIAQAGMRGTDDAGARSWLKFGDRLEEPKAGCITVLWRESPQSWKGHVGFFDGWDVGGRVRLLAGNQGGGVDWDEVCVTIFPKDRILGFRWPSNTI